MSGWIGLSQLLRTSSKSGPTLVLLSRREGTLQVLMSRGLSRL